MFDGVDLHKQDVGGLGLIDQRVQRRVARIAAVPVMLTVDFHGLEQRWQAGRRHHGIRAQPGAREDFAAPGAHVGGAHKHLGPARRSAGAAHSAQQVKVHLALQQAAQRVDVERIGLVGREPLAHQPHHGVGGRQGRAPHQAAQRAHALPQPGKRFTRLDATGQVRFVRVFVLLRGFGKAVRHGHGIHRAGAGAAHAIKLPLAILQQGIQHTPGERTVGAPTLQGQVQPWQG